MNIESDIFIAVTIMISLAINVPLLFLLLNGSISLFEKKANKSIEKKDKEDKK